MRLIAIPLIALACASASAERLITIPLGRKTLKSHFKLEGDWKLSDSSQQQAFLEAGLTKELDMGLEYFHDKGNNALGVDLSYNFLPPITDTSPGISLGVRDALDQTADRRRAFVAATFRIDASAQYNNDTPAECTLGFFFLHQSSPFVGFMLPVADNFHFLVEHNGYRLSAGAEIFPIQSLGLRWTVQDQTSRLGLQYQGRF